MSRKLDAILLFIACSIYNVSGDVCPASGKVVHTCQASSMKGPSMYLDSSNSVGFGGICTCFIQAINGNVTVTLSAQPESSTGCMALIDIPVFEFMVACHGNKINNVTKTLESGSQDFITLNRLNKGTDSDFCVHLEQTVQEGDGELSLTCLERDIDDMITPNTPPPSPTQTTVASTTPLVTPTEGGSTNATAQPVTTTTPLVTPTEGGSTNATAQPVTTTTPLVTPTEGGSTNATAQPVTTTTPLVSPTEGGSTNATAQPVETTTQKNGENTTALITTTHGGSNTSTAQPVATTTQKNGGQTNTSIPEATTGPTQAANTTSTVNETTSPGSRNVTSTTKRSGYTKAPGGVTGSTDKLSDGSELFVSRAVQSYIVVGILGGIILLLVMLAVFVYLRDRYRFRGSSHPHREEEEPKV